MQQSDLQQIMRAAGVEPTTSNVTFTGVDDPVYPSPLRLGAGMASVLANVAGAIDEIAAAKTGRRQAIEIDVGHALVSISSMWVLKVDGVPATEAFDIGITPRAGHLPHPRRSLAVPAERLPAHRRAHHGGARLRRRRHAPRPHRRT